MSGDTNEYPPNFRSDFSDLNEIVPSAAPSKSIVNRFRSDLFGVAPFIALVMEETGLSWTQVLLLLAEGRLPAIVPPHWPVGDAVNAGRALSEFAVGSTPIFGPLSSESATS